MGTATATLTGSIVHITVDRLHDMWVGYTPETRLDFVHLGADARLPVRIEKFEGQFGFDDLTLYGMTTWQHTSYKVKIVFTFHADGNPKKVAGAYEMKENVLMDDRDLGKD